MDSGPESLRVRPFPTRCDMVATHLKRLTTGWLACWADSLVCPRTDERNPSRISGPRDDDDDDDNHTHTYLWMQMPDLAERNITLFLCIFLMYVPPRPGFALWREQTLLASFVLLMLILNSGKGVRVLNFIMQSNSGAFDKVALFKRAGMPSPLSWLIRIQQKIRTANRR